MRNQNRSLTVRLNLFITTNYLQNVHEHISVCTVHDMAGASDFKRALCCVKPSGAIESCVAANRQSHMLHIRALHGSNRYTSGRNCSNCS